MPMYEYACRSCDHTFTARRNSEDRDREINCPICADTHVSRLLATFMVRGSTRSATAVADDCGPDGCAAPAARSHGFGCACCQ